MTSHLMTLGGLWSGCGGPLLVIDLLKGRLGVLTALLIGLLPIGLMMMGALHLESGPGDRLGRRFVELGRVSMYVMVGMQLYGIWLILRGLQSPALPLYCTGIAVGLVSAWAYQVAATRWIARDRANSPGGGPDDHRPIDS